MILNEESNPSTPSPSINQQPMESKSQDSSLSLIESSDSQPRAPNIYAALTNRIQRYRQWLSKSVNTENILRRISWDKVFELALITLWAIWVGRKYLDLDQFVWPNGREFGAQIQTHHFWTQLLRCGVCALWNGGINGGYPALADIFGSTLHPLIAITTLIWGVVNGSKVAVVLSLVISGIAQWSIARTLRLGRVARVWTALMVIVGGHLTGRLETPALGIVYSTAMTSLTLAIALRLAIDGRRHTTIVLALIGAVTIVSGQGYMQLSLLAWAPAFLFLALDGHFKIRPIWREFVIAIGLCLLIASVFLIPMLNLWPKVDKAGDVDFKPAQLFEYVPLNLLIRDPDFLRGSLLGKMPFPTLYNLYIGWVPVLLAMLCIVLARRNDLPVLFFLLSGILLMLFMASAIPLRWMINITPIFSGFRHTPLLAGLAVPALLGLAGYGLDRLLSLEWPQVNFHLRPNIPESSRKYSLAWLLIIPLILSGKAAYDFSQNWFTTYNNQSTYESLTSFETTSLQWIALPFGEHFWIEPALDKGLKITNVVWAWDWNDREPPKPKLEAYRGEAPVNTENVAVAGGVPVYLYADNEYTFVDLGDQIVPCTASGSGGDINVQCFTNDPGQLTVKENSWRGWIAWQDGERIPLLSNRWLSTEAPPGKHEYRFRYIPFDVIAGSILSLFGLVLTIWLWRRAAETNTNHEV